MFHKRAFLIAGGILASATLALGPAAASSATPPAHPPAVTSQGVSQTITVRDGHGRIVHQEVITSSSLTPSVVTPADLGRQGCLNRTVTFTPQATECHTTGDYARVSGRLTYSNPARFDWGVREQPVTVTRESGTARPTANVWILDPKPVTIKTCHFYPSHSEAGGYWWHSSCKSASLNSRGHHYAFHFAITYPYRGKPGWTWTTTIKWAFLIKH